MNTAKQYLMTFFQEKQIQPQIFNIKDKTSNYHVISTEVVIENILTASDQEQTQIANVIRKIDLINGNLHHFLKYLAHGVVAQYCKS